MCTQIASNIDEIIIGEVETINGMKGQLVEMKDRDALNTVGYIGDGVFYKVIPAEIQVHSINNTWVDAEGNEWRLKNDQ